MRRLAVLLPLLTALVVGGSVVPSSATSTTTSISGTVTYPAGVTDISVQLYRTTGDGRLVTSTSRSVAADGSWELRDLEPGTYRVGFHEPNGDLVPTFWGGPTLPTARDIVLAAGQSVTGVDVAPEDGGRITGRVRDDEGHDLAGANVALYRRVGPSWDVVHRTRTTTHRSFTFWRLPAGTYRLGVDPGAGTITSAPLAQFYPASPTLDGADDIVVTAGAAALDLVVQLPAHRAIEFDFANRPRVTGSGEAGTTAVATAGGREDVTVLSRQWYRTPDYDAPHEPIAGATGDTLLLTPDLVGQSVYVRTIVRAPGLDDTAYWGEWMTVTKGRFPQSPAVSTTSVQAGATAKVRLTGSWSPAPSTVTYRWFRDGRELSGAAADTLRIPLEDAGRRFHVEVTAATDVYRSVLTSDSVEAAYRPQVVRRQPTLRDVRVGARAAMTTEHLWTPGPDGPPSYQWYLDGRLVRGADDRSLPLGPQHVGHRVHVVVSAWATGYATSVLASRPVVVAPATFLDAHRPTIKGTARTGRTLRLSMRAWYPRASRVTYRWYADGRAIRGANRSSLKLAKALKGRSITVRATGSRAGYRTTTVASKAVRVRR